MSFSPQASARTELQRATALVHDSEAAGFDDWAAERIGLLPRSLDA